MKHLNVFFGRTDLLTLLCHFTISFYIRSLIRRVQTKSPSSKNLGGSVVETPQWRFSPCYSAPCGASPAASPRALVALVAPAHSC